MPRILPAAPLALALCAGALTGGCALIDGDGEPIPAARLSPPAAANMAPDAPPAAEVDDQNPPPAQPGDPDPAETPGEADAGQDPVDPG